MSFDLTAREIMEKLISFPTVSSESNLELISWVERILKSSPGKIYSCI